MSRHPAAGPGHVAMAGAGALDVTTADTSLGKGGHRAEFRIEGVVGTDTKAAPGGKAGFTGPRERWQLLPSFSLCALCLQLGWEPWATGSPRLLRALAFLLAGWVEERPEELTDLN